MVYDNLDLLVEVPEVSLASISLNSFFLLLRTVRAGSIHALYYTALVR